MAITWNDVTLIAPNLSTASLSLQTLVLAIVNRQVDADRWGEFADDGRLFLAAHVGTLATTGNGSGPITQETLGAMSRSYAVPLWMKSSLALTKYGAEYERLLLIAAGPAVFVP